MRSSRALVSGAILTAITAMGTGCDHDGPERIAAPETSVSGALTATTTTTTTTTPTPPPPPATVPLDRTGWIATASAQCSSNVPANAIDGDPMTRWSTCKDQVPGQSLTIDMKTPQSFLQIALDAGSSSNDYPRRYEVFVSADGVNFGTAVAKGTGSSPLVTIKFPVQTARYLKVVQTGTASFWWSVHELQVFGTEPACLPTVLSTSGWVGRASSVCQPDVASRALDGNADTRWSSGVPQADGQFFDVDMRSPRTFNRISLDAGRSTGDYPRRFTVHVSNDGVNYGGEIARSTGSGPLVTVDFSSQTARFVRVILRGSASNWWSIHEFKALTQDLSIRSCGDVPPNTPIHRLPPSRGELATNVNGDGTGKTTATSTLSPPVTFTLPPSYPVASGVIGNGTAVFKYQPPTGNQVTCTYKGASPNAAPLTPDDLNKGRLLNFVSCTDGLPASAKRTATKVDLAVTPAPGYPVAVTSPMQQTGGCHESLELLSADETNRMRTAFKWSAAAKVAAKNTDGTDALYYSWIYIRNRAEALALRKLYIHVLTRPLFNEELDRFAGRCGAFTNPGDGTGTFVPTLIPGATYNKLIDALTSDQLQGERVVFDAVIIRTVPAAARNANGSVKLTTLAESGFRYLNYEPNPLPAQGEIVLDGGASKVFTDVLSFVGETAKNVGQEITNTLAKLDKFFRGRVRKTLFVEATTADSLFSGAPVMIRGWGPNAGQPLAVGGMEVTILQKLFDLPLPTTSQGDTDETGRVVIDAVKNGDTRGSGLCFELKSASALVTDFLISSDVCDFRAFSFTNPLPTDDFRLDFNVDQTLSIHVSNPRMMGLFQGDDVYQYGRKVTGITAKRARILTGYWAGTFSGSRPDGQKVLWTGCLNFANSISDALVAAAFTAGALSQVVFPMPLRPVILATFTAIIVNSDIVMPEQSNLPGSREVMSHEYGHYMTCNLLQLANPNAVEHMAWASIGLSLVGLSKDKRVPLHYINEAMAEYFAGQVAGGADYGWLPPGPAASNNEGSQFCVEDGTSSTAACWDDNARSHATSAEDSRDIARIATLVHDAFDGQNGRRTLNPNDADSWERSTDPMTMARVLPLIFADASYGSQDVYTSSIDGVTRMLEGVSLRGTDMRSVTSGLALGLLPFGVTIETFNDRRLYSSLNSVMSARGVNWCGRCRVFALHSDTAPANDIGSLLQACRTDTLIAGVLGAPPEPSLRLDGTTCVPCPAGQISNADGVCVACVGDVHGNSCDRCGADVTLDAAVESLDRTFNTGAATPGDTCPELFVVEVKNPASTFDGDQRAGYSASVSPAPVTKALCERPFQMKISHQTAGGFVDDQTVTGTGTFVAGCSPPACFQPCTGLPSHVFTGPEVSPNATQRLAVPADVNTTLSTRGIVIVP